MANLLDLVKEHLHRGFIAETAHMYREGEEQTAMALQHWSAAILAGLLGHVDNPRAMKRIYRKLDQFPPDILEKPERLLRSGNLAHNDPKEVSGHLLGELFGDKFDALTKSIASLSGVSPANASHLLGIAGPAVLSMLGKRIQAGAMNVSGLGNMLRADQKHIRETLPEELTAILAITAPAGDTDALSEPATDLHWVFPLLLLLGLGGAILVYLRQCG